MGKVSPILVTLTSHSDSDFECLNVSLKENKPDGVNPNSNDIDYYVRENEGKILWFSADCTDTYGALCFICQIEVEDLNHFAVQTLKTCLSGMFEFFGSTWTPKLSV